MKSHNDDTGSRIAKLSDSDLFGAKADLNAKDNHGMTALMIAAEQNGNTDIVRILKEAGAK